MVMHGKVWKSMLWCGVMWCGVVRRGLAWRGVAEHGCGNLSCSFAITARCNMTYDRFLFVEAHWVMAKACCMCGSQRQADARKHPRVLVSPKVITSCPQLTLNVRKCRKLNSPEDKFLKVEILARECGGHVRAATALRASASAARRRRSAGRRRAEAASPAAGCAASAATLNVPITHCVVPGAMCAG